MNKHKKMRIFGMVFIIIIFLVLLLLTNIETKETSFLEQFTNKIVLPIQNGLVYLKNKIAGNTTFFENIDMLQQENKNLQEKNQKLEQQLRELEIIKAENATLREYVNMADKYSEYTTVPAYIIEKDLTNLNNIIIINVGTKDGVYEGMPVITDQGLVGYTISATKDTAKVKTIIDSASSTSAVTKISQDNVVAKGMTNNYQEIKLNYIDSQAQLIVGDTIETSGLGGIYPKGILIGTIKEIIETKNISERYAIVKTAVDFEKLDTVLVITQ